MRRKKLYMNLRDDILIVKVFYLAYDWIREILW